MTNPSTEGVSPTHTDHLAGRRRFLELCLGGTLAAATPAAGAEAQERPPLARLLPAPAMPVVDARFPAEIASGVFVLPDRAHPPRAERRHRGRPRNRARRGLRAGAGKRGGGAGPHPAAGAGAADRADGHARPPGARFRRPRCSSRMPTSSTTAHNATTSRGPARSCSTASAPACSRRGRNTSSTAWSFRRPTELTTGPARPSTLAAAGSSSAPGAPRTPGGPDRPPARRAHRLRRRPARGADVSHRPAVPSDDHRGTTWTSHAGKRRFATSSACSPA